MLQVAVRAWGNSQGIRLPKEILDQLGITVSDVLNVKVENGMIVLQKEFTHRSFKERLADYDGEISVYEFDWGDPVGKEIL